MLKKENRISLNKDFDRVFKFGQSFYSNIIGIKAVDNNLKEPRFGILVSTKVSKKAVIRNKNRRLIRESIKSLLTEIVTKKDIVVIVFPLILDKNFQEISQDLKRGFKKLGIIKR